MMIDTENFITEEMRKLERAFNEAGFGLRIVGGAVRDKLLGKEPKDIDMATDATPNEMIGIFQDNDLFFIETGVEHGTLTVRVGEEFFEITTLRVDADTDGRRATVNFTRDWRTDAERRDLTFNAMSMDFQGNVFDYFDGITDLENGMARFVGDASERMREDYLRILRYFRFQSRMENPTWDEETLAAIRNMADGLNMISGERIWMEMEKILASKNAYAVVSMMNNAGILPTINLPATRLDALGFIKTISDDPLLALAALLDTPRDLLVIKSFWKISNEVYDTLHFILLNREFAFDLRVVKSFLVNTRVNNDHVAMLASYKNREDIMRELADWDVPTFPVDGNDLIAIGMEPGPKMGAALDELYRKWENSDFTLTKNELVEDFKLRMWSK